MVSTTPRGAKTAATKIGISVKQYLQNRNSGLKWCPSCKSFIDRDYFCNAADKSDGKHSQCKNCEQVSARRRYKPIPPDEKKPRTGRRGSLPRDGDKKQARQSVYGKVRSGKLAHPRTLPCTDCEHIGGDKQHEYDHYLGYAAINHLVVECVCSSCHHKRERRRKKNY